MFALLLVHEISHEERFAHEDLSIHVLECFESIFRLVKTNESVATVHLLLLVTFSDSLYLDFD